MITRPPYHPLLYPTVITFDNLADGTMVDMLYAAKGVTFESFVDTPAAMKWSAFARYDPEAESPKNVISINDVHLSGHTNTVTPFFGGDFGGFERRSPSRRNMSRSTRYPRCRRSLEGIHLPGHSCKPSMRKAMSSRRSMGTPTIRHGSV